ncbi:hypothetical protein AB0D10_41120 [Kitasatospora sp. NPDC048545]|uniref:hypothetical protein n=1 Tax=Kitasatospora sp. NPDC048545 TaxID=3157208 RepID=UPI0033C751CE
MAQPLRSFGPRVPWGPRLLLLAALLLGIVTMHTLGHPTGAHGGHDRHPAARPAAGGEQRLMDDDRQSAARHPAIRQSAARHPAVRQSSAGPAVGTGHPLTDDDRHPAVRHAPGVDPAADGMDPMSVCLAVLAGWTVVLLVVGPLLRRSGDAAAEVRARLLRAVRALPPPGGGRILLARLSVLRQ